MKYYNLFILFFISIILLSCKKDLVRNNPFDAKSDNIEPLLTWHAHDDYFINEHDKPNFDIISEDLDHLSINSESSFFKDSAYMAFGNFYSIDPANLMPNDQEGTAYFIAACSWFEYDQCCADNWFEFGPITIPNSGATLRFSYKGVEGYEDGFEVLLSTDGIYNYYFTNSAVFFKADQSYEGGKWHTDSVIIEGFIYGGQELYFAFHHNAHNMKRLRLDNFQVTRLIK